MELISRRVALQAIARLKSDYDCDYNTIVEKCRDAVKRLPAHGEERKTGRWIRRHSKMWECSECERGCRWRENYCPDCGAKMEVDEPTATIYDARTGERKEYPL